MPTTQTEYDAGAKAALDILHADIETLPLSIKLIVGRVPQEAFGKFADQISRAVLDAGAGARSSK